MASNPGVRDLGEYASYHKLASFLGKKDARTIAHNTVVVRVSDSQIGVILHSTRILTFDLIGNVTLNSGGYHTVTTKQRLNQFLRPHGWSVEQKKYEWYVRGPNGEKEEFEDHMVLQLGSTLHPSSLGYGGPLRRENPRAYVTGDFGDSEDYEARIEHDIEAPQQDDFAPYDHPGKFEGQPLIVLRLREMTMEGGDEELSGEGFGWYSLVKDVKTADGVLHFIVEEDEQGFFSIWDSATSKKRIDESWARLQEEYEDWSDWSEHDGE